MFLNFRINLAKRKLDKYVEKYGLHHEKTMKASIKANNLINKHYSTEK